MRNALLLLCAFSIWAYTDKSYAQEDGNPAAVTFETYEMARDVPWSIDLIDEVSDGCMPAPDSIREIAELRLRAASIQVNKESLRSFTINALGYGNDDYNCAIYLQINVYSIGFFDPTAMPPYVYSFAGVRVSNRGVMLTGPKDNMQTRIRDSVAEMTDALALEILRARDEVARVAAMPENASQ